MPDVVGLWVLRETLFDKGQLGLYDFLVIIDSCAMDEMIEIGCSININHNIPIGES